MSLEIKRNIFQHIIYEIETEFDNSSTLSFLTRSKYLKNNNMLTTYFSQQNILVEEELTELKNHVEKYIQIFTVNIINKKNYKILDSWLQAYRQMDSHGLHIHEKTLKSWSLIFYIQCSEESAKTTFYSVGYPYVDSLDISISPKNSKFVIFPGYIPHEVGANKDDKRIIFSCNFEVE
jgi:predicted adenine nucleotide alpha hydrolase (AANH) superfamily ATPase